MFTYQGLIFETPPPCRAQARGGRMGIRDWKNIGGLVNCAIDDEVSRGGGLSSSLSSRAFGRCIRGFITNRQGNVHLHERSIVSFCSCCSFFACKKRTTGTNRIFLSQLHRRVLYRSPFESHFGSSFPARPRHSSVNACSNAVCLKC